MLSEALQSADSGDISAISNLGFMYVKGIGIEKNEEEGVKWYRKAAELGHLTSQFNLGVIYAKSRSVEQNYAESLKWYKMAAEQGDLTAQATLGTMDAKGIGLSDDESALHWYMEAASRGDVNAQYNLGNIYAKGIGADLDESEAFRWYQKAAEQNHPNAQLNLAYMYGKGGVLNATIQNHLNGIKVRLSKVIRMPNSTLGSSMRKVEGQIRIQNYQNNGMKKLLNRAMEMQSGHLKNYKFPTA